ncbi:hypothetical protein [Thermogutta sp.]|uniref:hypothetical protein n=1 Tax=Thermogutta sp. TaxID=1962930 RepID=UPI0032200136
MAIAAKSILINLGDRQSKQPHLNVRPGTDTQRVWLSLCMLTYLPKELGILLIRFQLEDDSVKVRLKEVDVARIFPVRQALQGYGCRGRSDRLPIKLKWM